MPSLSLTAEACSWVNCELTVLAGPLGVPIPMQWRTVQSWSYDTKKAKKPVYGAGDSPIDYTEGQWQPGMLKVKIGIADWNKFLGQVGGASNAFSKSSAFSMTINYMLIENLATYMDAFGKCTVESMSISAETGLDEVNVELEIRPLSISPGGLSIAGAIGAGISAAANLI